MNKKTAGALALTAFTLAGCGGNVLSTEEAQEQLDAVFAEFDALPKYTQDRFQEFSDPDGECAVAYKDSERGIEFERKGVLGAYEDPIIAPQMVRVDCDDLQRAFQKAQTTLAVYVFQSLSGEDDHEASMNKYKARATDYVRGGKVLSIKTFGLE